MPVTIVVGGQYGSEGKGKVAALLASRARAPWLVRCGGPNSGHTVSIDDKEIVLRQVPSCADSDPRNVTFCIAAGCAVEESILLTEVEMLGIQRERIIVDPRAVVVTEEDREVERSQLTEIGSTCSGTGAALVRRMSRRTGVLLVQHSATLKARCRIESVAPLLHDAIDAGEEVVVEGTQGFGLSIYHGPHYPFVTARDTTAAGFAMEVGLSPRLVDRIVMVLRTFPIRVGGPSGPFLNETSWEEIKVLSGAPEPVPEYTSVTHRLRRVAHFDIQAVRTACSYNRPTSLAVMGLDRLDYQVTRATDPRALSETAKRFLQELNRSTGIQVQFGGTGFRTRDVVEMPVATGRDILTHE
jgi:adenylosuccinate synthase